MRTSSKAAEKAENASCMTLSTVSDLTMCWNARSFNSCSSSSARRHAKVSQSHIEARQDSALSTHYPPDGTPTSRWGAAAGRGCSSPSLRSSPCASVTPPSPRRTAVRPRARTQAAGSRTRARRGWTRRMPRVRRQAAKRRLRGTSRRGARMRSYRCRSVRSVGVGAHTVNIRVRIAKIMITDGAE